MPIQKEQLIALLRDRDFRDHFAADQLYELLAVQIRQLREKRQWTQAELGAQAGMQQVQVSRAENPDYTGSKISTLSKLARALDVALIVRLAPFSELIDWVANLSPASFEPASFDEELQPAFTKMALPQDDSTKAWIVGACVAAQEFTRALTAEEEPTEIESATEERRREYAPVA